MHGKIRQPEWGACLRSTGGREEGVEQQSMLSGW